jgi:periplasmic divalent cation tolerance protein
METSSEFRLVLVTAPDMETARLLAKAALEAGLTACANLIPNVESHYWWQGKMEQAGEVQLLFKTKATVLAQLEDLVRAKHPYDTPEFLVLPIEAGNERYFSWLRSSVAG